jgi:hypothetical protein
MGWILLDEIRSVFVAAEGHDTNDIVAYSLDPVSLHLPITFSEYPKYVFNVSFLNLPPSDYSFKELGMRGGNRGV